MKITEKLQKAEKEGRPFWSFEFFPPRTAQGLQNLYDRIERMRNLGPEFIDITWGAGGKNADLTNSLVQVCQATIGIETCMHLCCTEMPKENVEWALKQAKAHGCQNILALRGDPVAGTTTWEPTPGGFMRAVDLVRYIHEHYPNDFCVAVAGFPQGHPETPDADEGREQEMQWLKEKVDAGADFIFTQMFYDTTIFFDWVRRVRQAGIMVPIIPGIMPIQSWEKFDRWVQREKIIVPPHFYEALDPVKGDDEKVRQVGTKLVGDMCRTILGSKEAGIKGLHIYTLNLEKGARMLLHELGFEGRREQIVPLPWRPSLTPGRRSESIRPIFWTNRPLSYISRTSEWDEFPNGRWGDSRSPAFGDLDGYPVSIGINPIDAYKLWGHPTTETELFDLFTRFCRGDLLKLPWSSQPPSPETMVITEQLAMMNELGYLTINSQPAVDGVRSEDKVHGWGPAGGYVYQKAYLEFFVSPELLSPLLKRIERDPRITYFAVNKHGDLMTNTHSEGPNAVTWGVFAGKEIVQPTIVDAVSFIAWKDEAYELGLQWANLYPAASPARDLLTRVMNSFYLVNIVANDFKDGLSIFEPFLLNQTPIGKVVEGMKSVAVGVKDAMGGQ
ncbi:methylenetetrahydrofolate reductase [Cryptococcus depauperatus]